MGKREIRKAVEAKIELGYSRQHAFDEMRLERPETDLKRLADAVRYVPSLSARQHYRVEQGALLAVIAASALLQFIHAPEILQGQAVDAKTILLAIPVASIALGIGILRYHAQLYRWLAILSMYGIFRRMGVVHVEEMDAWTIAHYALTVASAALAFFLHTRLASNYRVLPGIDPPAVEFQPEPASFSM
ncbi:MAG: hypothetical protein ABI373_01645 [Flavobacteriales bacterium]